MISSGTPAAQGGDLFGQAAKDARVAGLEADDGLALPGGHDHLRIDLLLRDVSARAVMAQADQFGPGAGVRKRRRIDQIVVEDQVGPAEAFGGAERGPRVAGAGAGQVDPAEVPWLAAHRSIPKKAAAGRGLRLEPLDPLDGLFQIAGGDVAVELDHCRPLDRLCQPGDGRAAEPVANFPQQANLQIALSRLQIVAVGQDDALEGELDHADFRVVGQMKDARSVVEVVGVQHAVLGRRTTRRS